MPINILYCVGEPAQQRITQPMMPGVPRLGHPGVIETKLCRDYS